MSTIELKDLGTALNKIVSDLSMDTKELIAKSAMDLPRQFEIEAKAFYPSVLKQPTGQLIGSFAQVARQEGDDWIVGLSSDKEYAEPQHEGTAPYDIYPKTRKALRWKSGNGFRFAKHVHHPGLKPKRFFSIPIATVTNAWIPKILAQIGFKR